MRAVSFFLVLLSSANYIGGDNNVCKSTLGYYFWHTLPDCFYDPDVDSNLGTIAKRYGYDLETYQVKSPDGYISTMFRITNRKTTPKKSPVLLVHSAYLTATTYVLNKQNSLAFLLADAAYDVWLVDARGTHHSTGHLNLTVEDNKYWDFTFDDLVENDFGVYLDFVEKNSVTSKNGIFYVGHALGSALLMAYSSDNPEDANARIKMAVFMSPCADLHYTKTTFLKELLGRYGNKIWDVLYRLGMAKYVCADKYIHGFSKSLQLTLGSPALNYLGLNYFGPSSQIPNEYLPVIDNNVFRGFSLKTFIQFYQGATGDFGKYDFGSSAKNLEKYGTKSPPRYNVTKMKFPVLLVYSPDDYYATVKDVESLYQKLSPSARRYGKYQVTERGINHLGYVLAKNTTNIYDRILQLFDLIQ